MVNIDKLHSCPSCKADLTPDPSSDTRADLNTCWNCGRKLKNPTTKYFDRPDYICHQKDSLLEELDSGKLKSGDAAYDKTFNGIQDELVIWARECTTQDKMAPLYDAVIILENLIYTSTPPEDWRAIISLAKKIGTLANAIEQYFKAGGSSYDRKVRQLRPYEGENSWDQATATARRDP